MKPNLTDADYSMGSAEAWEPDERRNLRYNFLPIKQFSLIAENQKIFLRGRRGAGKSAMGVMLESVSPYEYKEAIQGETSEYGGRVGE
jgi:hypothetical protein